MPDARDAEIYPRYCFHLSPTVNSWCWLRISDIETLKRHTEFEGENFFFHSNLPIKWVRITGLVVAVCDADNSRLRILTIDDSSGKSIDIVIKRQNLMEKTDLKLLEGKPLRAAWAHDPHGSIDVGHVVDVKGGLSIFRGTRQIEVEKATVVKGTAQEVILWQKRSTFRRDILDTPWVLSRRDIRQCRKEADSAGSTSLAQKDKNRKSRKEHDKLAAQVTTNKTQKASLSARAGSAPTRPKIAPKPQAVETRKRLVEMLRDGSTEGKYSALGL